MVSSNPTTPAMLQYLAAKAQHPDALLFFRMGDFYELFFDDATEAAGLLELTLTSRNKNSANPVPMAGVPHHAASNYIQRLVEMGHKVAICEQVEDPSQAKGVVKREVTHVVTPGINLDADSLASDEPNHLLALHEGMDGWALSWADVTTGAFRGAVVKNLERARAEIARIAPREIILSEDAGDLSALELDGILISRRPRSDFESAEAHDQLAVQPGALAPESTLVQANAGLLSYLHTHHASAAQTLRPFEPVELSHSMALEETTLRHLELLRTLITGRRRGSLLGILDETATAMGARLLRERIQFPLIHRGVIEERLNCVEALRNRPMERDAIRDCLRNVYDLERLCGRLLAGIASPRDLDALRTSSRQVPALLKAVLETGEPALQALALATDDLAKIHQDLHQTLAEEPAQHIKDGNVIAIGVDDELDELLTLSRDGKAWLLAYEAEQREATSIQSLKVRYNKVFGYYIEVTRANVHLVPEHFVRKQTLVNAERYFTEELKDYEEKVLSAEDRRIAREHELFNALRARLLLESNTLSATATALAEIDVHCALAEVAARRNYVRPSLDDSRTLIIKNGRHPVVEALLRDEPFVPNDIHLNAEDARLLLITGPNMAGKSTVMRQTALIVLLAQMGSFVPADEAHVGIVDRIFTRVGAADDLSRGQSTFMVEMNETATILEKATERSLVILDEIGRGTSTFDGVSIAWAVAEHLHDAIGARTLFATHYHELTALEDSHEGVANRHVAVHEFNEQIVFLRTLVDGGTNRSYGIQVGRLAGLPESVVLRARAILADLERFREDGTLSPEAPFPGDDSQQMSLFMTRAIPSEVDAELSRMDLNTLTPIDALNVLHRWQKTLSSKEKKGNQPGD